MEFFFFPLIGEKARGQDKKDEPNQTTGDRTQGKKRQRQIESDREQETGKGRWGLRQQGKAGECRKSSTGKKNHATKATHLLQQTKPARRDGEDKNRQGVGKPKLGAIVEIHV